MKVHSFILFVLLLASRPSTASTNRQHDVSSAASPAVTSTNDPVEQAYEKLMLDDDAALDEVDGWIKENRKFAVSGAGVSSEELNRRIKQRFEPVRQAYEDFVRQNPNHGRARLAYASFLEDSHEEKAALEQMLKAKEVDPRNPAVWNNLGNFYGHFSPASNAFPHYEKAIELDPEESIYYHNFGTTVFLFRSDAKDYFHITEQQVFDKALSLYSNSLALDPNNFLLATDIARTHYGIKPLRTNDALAAWEYALKQATDELEREGVFIHLARLKMVQGFYAESRAQLDAVTNAGLAELKARLLRNIEAREHPATEQSTNAVTATQTNAPAASP